MTATAPEPPTITFGRRGNRPPLLRLLVTDRIALIAAFYLLLLSLAAAMLPLLVDLGLLYSPTDQNLFQTNAPPGVTADGQFHLLGTDQLGRDMLSRFLVGARLSLLVGLCAIAISGTVGLVLGLIAGFKGGRFDDVLMRLVDIQMAFPTLLLALLVLYVTNGGFQNLILVLAATRWPVIARVTRGMALSLRERQFVEASATIGASTLRILRSDIFPNLISTVLALCTIEFARAMLTEAGLSFLGLGIQPPDTSWGLMIAQGRAYMANAWWLIAVPGIGIALSAMSVNLLSSWLRIISDPVERSRASSGRRNRKVRPPEPVRE